MNTTTDRLAAIRRIIERHVSLGAYAHSSLWLKARQRAYRVAAHRSRNRVRTWTRIAAARAEGK